MAVNNSSAGETCQKQVGCRLFRWLAYAESIDNAHAVFIKTSTKNKAQ